jgi:hypothetical protein
MADIFNLSDTWNDGATTFKGIGLNVTDTASASGSLLMDLQVGGVSRFSVAKGGTLSVSDTGGRQVHLSGNSMFLKDGLSKFSIWLSPVTPVVGLSSDTIIGWNSGTSHNSTYDLSLFRDAADTLAQRRSTNPQAFRISNTHTDASNYERGKIAWESNVLRIGTEKAGTGSARALELQTDGVTRVTIGTTGVVNINGTTVAGNGGVSVAQNIEVADARYIGFTNRTILRSEADGVLKLSNWLETDFSRLQFGGTTSSFPALKRSTTSLQVRLADDSAFTNVQGKLTTETAYTAGAPTATGYLVLYDSNGTAYKVPAEAL